MTKGSFKATVLRNLIYKQIYLVSNVLQYTLVVFQWLLNVNKSSCLNGVSLLFSLISDRNTDCFLTGLDFFVYLLIYYFMGVRESHKIDLAYYFIILGMIISSLLGLCSTPR